MLKVNDVTAADEDTSLTITENKGFSCEGDRIGLIGLTNVNLLVQDPDKNSSLTEHQNESEKKAKHTEDVNNSATNHVLMDIGTTSCEFEHNYVTDIKDDNCRVINSEGSSSFFTEKCKQEIAGKVIKHEGKKHASDDAQQFTGTASNQIESRRNITDQKGTIDKYTLASSSGNNSSFTDKEFKQDVSEHELGLQGIKGINFHENIVVAGSKEYKIEEEMTNDVMITDEENSANRSDRE